MTAKNPHGADVVLLRGGCFGFVSVEEGWSGPWRSEEAATFAGQDDFDGAWRVERATEAKMREGLK